MKNIWTSFIIGLLTAVLSVSSALAQESEKGKQWSVKKANEWYWETGWLVGANYTPRTAINQLEMWQEETFDPKTID